MITFLMIMIIITVFSLLWIYPIRGKDENFKFSLNTRYKSCYKEKLFGTNQDILYENLYIFDDICNKHNLFFWLSQGTALGAIREQKIIHNDNDIDIDMWYKDKELFINKCAPELVKRGFKIMFFNENTRIKLTRKYEIIDLDLIGPENNRVMSSNSKKLTYEEISPYLKKFNRSKLGERFFNVPLEDYLVFTYGNDWKTPRHDNTFRPLGWISS